ncbi:uncharacterized protein LOC109727050 [Ananas comosus]|uniref:Uncharacterized protein LOC109727050 n=2 Tax=Ananas comosus TaxID=4615 RepID=A0A199VG34_ANACO|nr:uncharacterized protein LOC109727050 [Ananas comosus]XP_020112511.1 uncharacterized protein LOC109727050 [Ananas comosus]OAY75826.1 hypothetical protein ACMD2_01409 [Ananas comosus]CAD1830835.1 unnamed protein product [Ananas comosus var. bracteatus]
MEVQLGWRMRVSLKNATMAVCFLNVVASALLFHRLYGGASPRRSFAHHLTNAQLRYISESEELRLAMEPVDLIRRIKEIEQEAYAEPEGETEQAPKLSAAADLSRRLKDRRAVNDADSQKALEEWRKRKVERARQREIEKNRTVTQM